MTVRVIFFHRNHIYLMSFLEINIQNFVNYNVDIINGWKIKLNFANEIKFM